MGTEQLFERLGIALAIGLLIGAERGWRERQAQDGARAAGIRTHTLIGLLGGIWGLLAAHNGNLDLLGFAALAFTLTFGFFEWQETKAAGSVSATGLIAGLLTFALGAYAVQGNLAAAVSAAVASTVVLAERQALHRFLQRMTWTELRAALILLVMTFVFLPILPNRPVDPWGALNPHQLWLMTVMIAAVSYGGYIAVRLAGGRNGLLFAGLAGGLVSSTTVSWTFARLAKEHQNARMEIATGVLGSWIVSLVRMTAVASVISLPLLSYLAFPIAGAVAMLLAVTAFAYWRAAGDDMQTNLKLEDPFDLFAVLRLGALFAAIMLIATWVGHSLGDVGLISLGAVSGLADVDPITLSMAQQSGHTVEYSEAALVILVAASANVAAKSMLAILFGGVRFASILVLAMVLAGGCAALIFSAVQ